jgi:AP-1 complex subunit gamma-1
MNGKIKVQAILTLKAGNYVKEQILSSFVRLIATTPELQTYSVQKLYAALKDDISQEGLTLAGAWVIGEYADSLLKGGTYEEEELVKEVKQGDVVDLFTTILNSSYANQVVTEYIVTSAMKLTTRLTENGQVERLRRLLMAYQTNLDVEIQQRAAEYSHLFTYDQVRRGVLERMPPPEIREEQRVLGESMNKKKPAKTTKKKPSQMTEQDMLLDLMGGSDMPTTDASATVNGSQNNADLLADILGGGTSSPPQTSSPAPGQPQSNVSSIMDLFGTPSGTSAPQARGQPPSGDLFGGISGMASPPPQMPNAPGPGPTGYTAYQKNDLHIVFQIQRGPSMIQVLAKFKNTSAFDQLSAVNLQAAVPKSQKLQLQPISSSELSGGQEATQQMKVAALNGVSVNEELSKIYLRTNG